MSVTNTKVIPMTDLDNIMLIDEPVNYHKQTILQRFFFDMCLEVYVPEILRNPIFKDLQREFRLVKLILYGYGASKVLPLKPLKNYPALVKRCLTSESPDEYIILLTFLYYLQVAMTIISSKISKPKQFMMFKEASEASKEAIMKYHMDIAAH